MEIQITLTSQMCNCPSDQGKIHDSDKTEPFADAIYLVLWKRDPQLCLKILWNENCSITWVILVKIWYR